jgi:hypothetical protein
MPVKRVFIADLQEGDAAFPDKVPHEPNARGEVRGGLLDVEKAWFYRDDGGLLFSQGKPQTRWFLFGKLGFATEMAGRPTGSKVIR